MLKNMEYDALPKKYYDLMISFEDQFNRRGSLTDTQYEILECIFKEAVEKHYKYTDCI